MQAESAPADEKPPARRRDRKEHGFLVVLSWQVGLLVGFLLIWELAIRAGWLRVYVYGAPSGIIQAFGKQLADGSLLVHFWVTAEESILGLVIGGVLGSLCGLLLWLSDLAGRV